MSSSDPGVAQNAQPLTAAAAPSFALAPFGQFSSSAKDVQQLPQHKQPRYVPGRVLVKFRRPLATLGSGTSRAALFSAAEQRLRSMIKPDAELASVTELGSISQARLATLTPASVARRSGRYVLTFKSTGTPAADVVSQLRAHADVEWAELDGIYDLFVTPNDPNYLARGSLRATRGRPSLPSVYRRFAFRTRTTRCTSASFAPAARCLGPGRGRAPPVAHAPRRARVRSRGACLAWRWPLGTAGARHGSCADLGVARPHPGPRTLSCASRSPNHGTPSRN